MELNTTEKIRLIANRKGISMTDIATQTGQTRQNLANKMARGNYTEKDLCLIAEALGCKLYIAFVTDSGERI